MFYLRSRHGDTGLNVSFHNKNGGGYGTGLDNLHIFSKEEAQRALDQDINSLPLLKSAVDSMAIRAVDMQHLKDNQHVIDPEGIYVVQIDRDWNGNDIYFKSGDGRTYNYDEASLYSYTEAMEIAATSNNLSA